MKKNTIKAFTLVEMLIVIVIIGILIAALMPRMQAAQGRARDVSRKTALSQIQSAIVTSQGDKGRWPGCGTDGTCAESGHDISDIQPQLQAAGMNAVPTDPTQGNKVKGLGGVEGGAGQYRYLVTTRNGASNGGFVLMAKTEVEGGSNWVTCLSGTTSGKDRGYITHTDDISSLQLCNTVSKVGKDACKGVSACRSNTGDCCYETDDELRYIVTY